MTHTQLNYHNLQQCRSIDVAQKKKYFNEKSEVLSQNQVNIGLVSSVCVHVWMYYSVRCLFGKFSGHIVECDSGVTDQLLFCIEKRFVFISHALCGPAP